MGNELIPQPSKFSVEIKQSAKGVYYLGSLKINAETVEELENLIDIGILKIMNKIDGLNAKIEKETPKESKEDIILNSMEANLFNKLKQLRFEISKQENVPAYVIFHDSVLKQLALKKPKTKEEMLNVPGIREKKYESYGYQFLKAINEFLTYLL